MAVFMGHAEHFIYVTRNVTAVIISDTESEIRLSFNVKSVEFGVKP